MQDRFMYSATTSINFIIEENILIKIRIRNKYLCIFFQPSNVTVLQNFSFHK